VDLLLEVMGAGNIDRQRRVVGAQKRRADSAASATRTAARRSAANASSVTLTAAVEG